MMGAFEAMTNLPEFRELMEDWWGKRNTALLSEIRRGVVADSDTNAARMISRAAGALNELDNFKYYVQQRIERERTSQGRPLPKELTHALRKVRGGGPRNRPASG